MKRLYITHIIALLMVCISLLSLSRPSYAQPKIVFEEEVYRFGDVMQGDNVEHVFEFRNEGNEELSIDKVSSS